jgi:hypothetical protein
MNTGEILDFYDDPTGLVLKRKLAAAQVPDYVRAAECVTPEKLASLPDDAFALVLVDQGKKLRKYACVDQGNTALSVIYFLDNQGKLTKEAQYVAATNLCVACEAFGVEPPLLLKAAAKTQKKADLTGTEVMPMQASHPGNDHASGTADESVPASSDTKKLASRYVDITGVSEPVGVVEAFCQKLAAAPIFALVKEGHGRFPLDSYGDVLTANRWFEENQRTLHPDERREYCTKLAARADVLGISVTDNIRKYAGTKFAERDDVHAAVATRMQFWSNGDPEKTLLDGLMGKYASVSPEVFCEALKQFDEATGLNLRWDSEVVDPVSSTFGFEKRAEWSWVEGPDVLKEDVLRNGVNDSGKIHQIKARFGGELASELAKKPIEVFGSLPLDTKRIVCHILQDTQP